MATESGEIATTKRQRDILRHALGLDRERKPYRNHFCTGEGSMDYPECRALEAMGLMASHKKSWIPDIIFVVTEAGKREIE